MKKKISTRWLARVAMLAAVQVVLAKFLMVQLAPSVRISVDSVPILLAGLTLGPVAGFLTGVIGDMVGTLLFPTAGPWYPPLTLCFGLLGFVSGMLKDRAHSKRWIVIIVAATELLGSGLCKTFVLTRLTGLSFYAQLITRLVPMGINLVLDAIIVSMLVPALKREQTEKPPQAKQEEIMTGEEAIDYIYRVHERNTVFGLGRIQTLLKMLGEPDKRLKFVHIAGTNGKGSTSAMLAKIFTAAGYRTGLYISPYITRFNERIQVDGEPISDADLVRLTTLCRDLTEDMPEKPTAFELITGIGFLYFAERDCDIVICEVGMGGRLDATNAIEQPELSIITRIGLDHTDYLGDTLAKIAAEKAGILKQGGELVYYGHEPEADAEILRLAKEKDCPCYCAEFDRVKVKELTSTAITFDYAPYEGLQLGLVSSYQLKNVAVVLKAVERLQYRGWRLSERAVRDGLRSVRWPARFERLSEDPPVIVDGGHNPQGVTAAVESLQLLYPNRSAVILLGIMADKDVDTVLSLIKPVARRFVTVTPDNPRAMPAVELSKKLVALGAIAEPAPSVEEGVRLALDIMEEGEVLLAVGSLYMAEAVRRCFIKNEEEA